MSEKISLDKMFGLPKPTEKLRNELFQDEKKKRKKQPEAWTKTKYRKAAQYRDNFLKNKKNKYKKEFIEEEKSDKWQTRQSEVD